MFRTKATSYAILAAWEIVQRQNGPHAPGVQASEVAQRYELPTAYASKIMCQLVKAQVFRSDRGPRGGFQLARPPEKISLLEMFEAVRGVIDPTGVHLGGEAPDALQRTVTGAVNKATESIRQRLSSVTLADLLKK